MRKIKMTSNDLFLKSFLGFDPLWKMEVSDPYPPHNIIRHGNRYRIEVAVAGFKRSELDVVSENNELIISGQKTDSGAKPKPGDVAPEYLHKGIATRKFSKKFTLSPSIQVIEAEYADGVLTIDLEEVMTDSRKRLSIK